LKDAVNLAHGFVMISPEQHTPARRCAALLLYAALAGCGGASGDTGPSGSVTVSVSPTTLNLFLGGGPVTATINVTRVGGYDRALTLSATGLPNGVTATFNPASLTGSALSSTLTLAAAADATTGLANLVVLVKGDSLSQGVPIPMVVGQPRLTVARIGTGTGTVTSSPAGINCGSTCNADFAFGTSVTLTATPGTASAIGGWNGFGCTGTSTTCTVAATSAPTITVTFNSTAPSFALGTPAPVTVPQGGNATATVRIARINGFASGVTFTSTGAPSGLTVTANPVNGTDTTATLNVVAATSLAASNYPITLTAAGSGVASQTTALSVQVTPGAGGSGNVAFNFATCDASEVPIWFAVQNGTGAWTRVTPGANNSFTFTAGTTGGVAIVTPDGTGFDTEVIYGSSGDITALALGNPCAGLHAATGTKRLTGTLSGADLTTPANLAIGGASTQRASAQGSGYTIDNVASGQRDLVGSEITTNAAGFPGLNRLVLRRNVDYATTIPALNLFGPEAVIPAAQVITTSNLGADQASSSMTFVTGNGATGPYFVRPALANGGVTFAGLPDTLLQAGDLHAVTVNASPASGTAGRFAIVLHHSVVSDAVTFGPPLNQPTVTSIGTSPYLRMHAQLASQTEYDAAAHADFAQNALSFGVTMTANYSGARPPNWTLDIPDLSSAGYSTAWGLKTGSKLDWTVTAVAGSVLPFLGATPVDGGRVLGASVGSSSTAFDRLRSLKKR
jgi:hypothetical protein